LLYFIVHNNTLSLFKEKPEKDLLNLHSKIAFHHPLLSCINDSKILNNVISQALDELNETMLAEELGHASVKTTVEIYVAPAHRDRIRKGSQRKL